MPFLFYHLNEHIGAVEEPNSLTFYLIYVLHCSLFFP